MDAVIAHGLTHGLVDHAMTRNTPEIAKCRADNAHTIVPATCLRPGMADVQMTVIDDFQRLHLECGLQALPDHRRPVGGSRLGHGSTRLNGLTVTRS